MPTNIEWATETWSPITGCTPISPGCKNCYAARMAKRLAGRFGYPADEPFRPTFHEDRLDQPFKWKKRRMIFVCSMGDLFVGLPPPEGSWPIIDRILGVCNDAPQHIFLLLTKRPEAAWYYFNSPMYRAPGLRSELLAENIWFGVTAENQALYDERWNIAAQIPAAVHFVSGGPLLGPIDIAKHEQRPDWFIVEGESGPGARCMLVDWARSLRDQCQAAGVPYFFKQHGEYLHASQIYDCKADLDPDFLLHCSTRYHSEKPNDMSYLVGKKKAGRLLDGRTHDEYPALANGQDLQRGGC